MNYGKVEEPSSSRSRRKSTARFAATSGILTVTLSRSDRAPTSCKADARPGWDPDLGADNADQSSKLLGLSPAMCICCDERTTDGRQIRSALIKTVAKS